MSELIQDGLAVRCVDSSATPPLVTYKLTDLGRSLIPLLDEVYIWAVRAMREKGMPVDPDMFVVHKPERFADELSDVMAPNVYADKHQKQTIIGRNHIRE